MNMNRRSLIAGISGVAAFGVGAPTDSHAMYSDSRLLSSIMSIPLNLQRSGQFRWDSVTPQEAMYVGIMATWDEVLLDMVVKMGAEIETKRRSNIVEGATKMSYGIQAIASDTRKITPPLIFEEAHRHFESYVTHVARAVDDLQIWGALGDSSYMERAIESLDSAAQDRGEIALALPYPLPNRDTLVP